MQTATDLILVANALDGSVTASGDFNDTTLKGLR